ncbi:hypothetical protein HOC35_02975 [Candidatus Woesearchaeota archaeon]|jgi:hypothetical protein|nr:hypothetical protein [Candidatus Woesearchaeota archaeon]
MNVETTKTQLYLVRTQVDATFLDREYRIKHPSETREQQVDLVRKISRRLNEEGYESFAPPFLGLLEDGRYVIPVNFQLCAYGVIKDGVSKNHFSGHERQLVEFIDGLVQGIIPDAPIWCRKIGAIVEYSDKPLLETHVTNEEKCIIAELSKRYEIVNITLN